MTTVNSATTAQATTTGAASKLNADFDMFLKLLTAQMQNQDPLDPMDTAQYTQQLVQYSQVEQSIEQTGTLKSILSSLGTQNLTQASSLVGRRIEADSQYAGLTDTPAQWGWTGTREVETITATITDEKGRVVDTRTVAAGAASGSLIWDGLTSSQRQMPAGTYKLDLKGVDTGGNEVPITIRSTGTVSDVQLENGAVSVTVNGASFSASELTRIGNAS